MKLPIGGFGSRVLDVAFSITVFDATPSAELAKDPEEIGGNRVQLTQKPWRLSTSVHLFWHLDVLELLNLIFSCGRHRRLRLGPS